MDGRTDRHNHVIKGLHPLINGGVVVVLVVLASDIGIQNTPEDSERNRNENGNCLDAPASPLLPRIRCN